MNGYVRLPALKGELGISATNTAHDAQLLAAIEGASAAIDNDLGRHFYSRVATLYPAWYGSPLQDRRLLPLPVDLVSVTSLKVDADGDGNFEITLVNGTDYSLRPRGGPPHTPYREIWLRPLGGQLSAWPDGDERVELVGIVGYSQETEVAGMLADGAESGETTVTMTAGHDVAAGDMLLIGGEQISVTAVEVDTLTVVRARNGTAAATHANGAVVLRRIYPRAIAQATAMQAARLFRAAQTGHGEMVGSQELGGFSFSATYPLIRDLLAPFRRVTVA